MNHVERFRAVMSFQPVDRLPVIEWAPYWDKTVERWHGEGLPRELDDPFDVRTHFGLDPYRQFWLRAVDWSLPAYKAGLVGQVKGLGDYLALRPSLYRLDSYDRAAVASCRAAHDAGDLVVWLSLDGFFWFPRTLFGIERHFYAFYDQPDLMHRINDELCSFYLALIEEFAALCRPDFMTFAEDMSYNHGPMLSEACFAEFIAPYYRRVTALLDRLGIPLIVDSDGDVTRLMPWLLDVGARGVLPLERQARVDVAELRRRHPALLMVGAYDKMVMTRGERAMRAEFERLMPVMRSGGFIPSVDHQTPPGVSLEEYRVYLSLLREYCALAAGKA